MKEGKTIVVQSMCGGFQCTQPFSFITSNIFFFSNRVTRSHTNSLRMRHFSSSLSSSLSINTLTAEDNHPTSSCRRHPSSARVWPESATIEFILTLVDNGHGLLEKGWRRKTGKGWKRVPPDGVATADATSQVSASSLRGNGGQ